MSKKNCVIARCAPASIFAREVVEVEVRVRRFRVHLGVGRDRDVEIADGPEPLHEVGGIREAAGVRLVGRLPGRRVAAQRDDVSHARVPVAARDVEDLLARRADAGQVRGRRKRGFAQDAGDRVVRALAGRPVRTVGDRYEARRERRETLDGLPQRALHLRVAGRKELERHENRPQQLRSRRIDSVTQCACFHRQCLVRFLGSGRRHGPVGGRVRDQ